MIAKLQEQYPDFDGATAMGLTNDPRSMVLGRRVDPIAYKRRSFHGSSDST